MLCRFIVGLLASFVSAFAIIPASAGNIIGPSLSGPVRGIQFFHLNDQDVTYPTNQNFWWVVDNLNGPYGGVVQAELSHLLTNYKAAGITTIRLLIASDHINNYCSFVAKNGNVNPNANSSICGSYSTNGYYGDPNGYPKVSSSLINAVSAFLTFADSGPYAGQFNFDISLESRQTGHTQGQLGYFCESEGGGNEGDTNNTNYSPSCSDPGYSDAEAFISQWINSAVYTQHTVVMTELGGNLVPCSASNCGTLADDPTNNNFVYQNHAEWIKAIWAWKQSAYPSLMATNETSASSTLYGPGSAGLQNTINWEKANMPGAPYIGMQIYIQEPPGTGWAQYFADTNTTLKLYTQYSGGSPPLWITEFGGTYGVYPAQTPVTVLSVQDAQNSLRGFMEASICGAGQEEFIPKLVWEGGDDYPNNPSVQNQTGLVKEFDGVPAGYNDGNDYLLPYPMMQPSWGNLSLLFNEPDNKTPANGSLATTINQPATDYLSGCGVSSGAPSFSVTSQPSHGSVILTDVADGGFTYTPAAGFVGTDSFKFTNGSGATSTVSIVVSPSPGLGSVLSYLVL